MVTPRNYDNWISIFGKIIRKCRMFHLIVRFSNSCNTSHPTVQLSSNCHHWNGVIFGWILNSFVDISSPNESSFCILIVICHVLRNSRSTHGMTSIENFLSFHSFVFHFCFHISDVQTKIFIDWNWSIIGKMRNSNPKWKWNKFLDHP